ncbi:hypothetical protein [Marinicrinis sediminis]|uniref:DUF3139 domain-containing protein n=1 Tax=Marinicrinis sediminis TaxID=1652465 RepID=A0ABW5RAK7_9BACL
MKNRKNKKIFIIILIGLIIFALIAIIGTIVLHHKHMNEIERIITLHSGEVVEVDRVRLSKSPFADESGSHNVAYKILFKKDGQHYEAWYRGIKTVNDIHSKRPDNGRGYPEKWIFIEDPITP